MARILDYVEEEGDEYCTPPHSGRSAPRRQPPRSLSLDHLAAYNVPRRRRSFQTLSPRPAPFLSPILGAEPRRTNLGKRPTPSRSSTMVDLTAPSTFDGAGYKGRPFSGKRAEVEERIVIGDWLKGRREREAREQAPVRSRIMNFEELSVKHKRRLSEIQQTATSELELEAAKKRYEQQKAREAREQEALARAQQPRRPLLSRFISLLTCGLVGLAWRKSNGKNRKRSSFNPHTHDASLPANDDEKETPPSPEVSPPPSISSVRLRNETKRISGISRVEEWKEQSVTSLVLPTVRPMGFKEVSRTRSAPELAVKSMGGGGKHHWLDY